MDRILRRCCWKWKSSWCYKKGLKEWLCCCWWWDISGFPGRAGDSGLKYGIIPFWCSEKLPVRSIIGLEKLCCPNSLYPLMWPVVPTRFFTYGLCLLTSKASSSSLPNTERDTELGTPSPGTSVSRPDSEGENTHWTASASAIGRTISIPSPTVVQSKTVMNPKNPRSSKSKYVGFERTDNPSSSTCRGSRNRRAARRPYNLRCRYLLMTTPTILQPSTRK